MPTQSDLAPHLTTLSSADSLRPTRSTCPPENDRITTWIDTSDGRIESNAAEYIPPDTISLAQPSSGTADEVIPLANATSRNSFADTVNTDDDDDDNDDDDDDIAIRSVSPTTSVSTQSKDETMSSPTQKETAVPLSPTTVTSMSQDFSNIRLVPDHVSSYLRAGSKFVGTQQSDRQIYNVDVEVKHVDMAESYLCGYLRIQGLTEDHPTLTTFFEGEMIGTKHTFQTRHDTWGATDKTDMLHWARFPAWRPLAKMAKKPDFTYKNFAQREDIFMRWKEYFLVPDHRVKTISGASFEGFYYICFNQAKATISGIYFHAKSEKYQQLELKHVENNGCFGATEFR